MALIKILIIGNSDYDRLYREGTNVIIFYNVKTISIQCLNGKIKKVKTIQNKNYSKNLISLPGSNSFGSCACFNKRIGREPFSSIESSTTDNKVPSLNPAT